MRIYFRNRYNKSIHIIIEVIFLGEDGGWKFYKARVLNVQMTNENINKACQIVGLETPCSCSEKKGDTCEITSQDNCENPMLELSQTLCNGTSPENCPQLADVFMHDGKYSCGVIGTEWCALGKDHYSKYALCVKPKRKH